MKIDATMVLVNLITKENIQERVPGQKDLAEGDKPEMRDMLAGNTIASALLHQNAVAVDGQKPKPENVLQRYKLAQKFVAAGDAAKAEGAKKDAGLVELDAKEATSIQEVVCTVFASGTISGQLCALLNG